MKIKVVTIKDIIKYLAKMSLIFGIITIFAKFFYDNKNVNNNFEFDSYKLASVIKQEVLLFRGNENQEFQISDEDYIKQTINGELSMFKAVAATTNHSTKITQNDNNLDNEENKDLESQEGSKGEEKQKDSENLEEAETGINVEVLPSNIPDKTTYEVFGVKIRNESDYNIQNEIKDLNVKFNKNNILIFHTHTCESYTPTEQNKYNSTGNFRTTDLNYSVARVGDELEKYLINYGYNVIHNKSYHDYPAYNGSYNRSLVTVENILDENPDTDVVIDLHRDAIGDNTYAPKVKIGDDYCARIMLVIGTDGGGLKHDNWRNNVKFAIKLAQKAEELYPGLCKPVIVRNSRYNHHVSNAAFIIEVGATGNTLEECLNSMKYLSKIYNEM